MRINISETDIVHDRWTSMGGERFIYSCMHLSFVLYLSVLHFDQHLCTDIHLAFSIFPCRSRIFIHASFGIITCVI